MSARGLCWCGRGREEHDGREMTADGEMHRFGEPLRESREEEPVEFHETRPIAASPLGRVALPADDPHPRIYVVGLLRRLKGFLDLSIIKPEVGGTAVCANAEKFSAEISTILLRGF